MSLFFSFSLIPKNDNAHHERTACLLDDVGTLLALPYDLTFPFARYVVRNKITNTRRITISRVYRKHEEKGKPRELYEADFDIVTPLAAVHAGTLVCDAEVIKVVTEILDYFSTQIGQYYIRVWCMFPRFELNIYSKRSTMSSYSTPF